MVIMEGRPRYPEFAAKPEELLRHGRQFLQKPLTLADLTRKVGEMLEEVSVAELGVKPS